MREPGSSLSLAGSLLIAHPGLLDPNFRKTVLLISAHDAEEGSFGVVLNRPADTTVSDLLPDRDMGPLGSVPVFVGGPVSRDQLIFVAFQWHPESERLDCRHHIGVEEAQQLLRDDNTTVRAFVGYAGWTKGQLESEMAQRAWMVKKPDSDILDLEKTETLWKELTATFGPWFGIVAEAPDDPSRN